MATAITFRMQAGFPGDVNRMHPASILPALNDGTSPVLTAGLVAMYNGASNDVRSVATGDEQSDGDTPLSIAGITVRAYPAQQATASTFGAPATLGGPEALASASIIDILISGLIMGVVVGTPNKGDPVFVWAAASSGAHIQGGFEATASDNNTFAIPGAFFNGPPDSSGNVEVMLINTLTQPTS